jgi:XTP/dITP diphosphohydrolase
VDGLIRAVVASTNKGKLRELAAVLPEWELEPLLRDDYPEETGETFEENALLKARFGREHAHADAWALGEDSGIEVDALGGRPGVRSARYAGDGASDEDNVDKLLDELAGVPPERRAARYVSLLVAIAPDGRELSARGTFEGSIAERPAGTGGFGYDPVFVPTGETKTVAELGDEWKAGRSHRAAAARALRARLGAL